MMKSRNVAAVAIRGYADHNSQASTGLPKKVPTITRSTVLLSIAPALAHALAADDVACDDRSPAGDREATRDVEHEPLWDLGETQHKPATTTTATA